LNLKIRQINTPSYYTFPSFNPATPKSVNKTRFKKGAPTPCSIGSMGVKRQYSSIHKTMVETTTKRKQVVDKVSSQNSRQHYGDIGEHV
jgi:hypothetical protein